VAVDILNIEARPIRSPEDIALVRQWVRSWAVEIGFSVLDQTKFVTAASEIARNTVDYGGGGTATLEQVRDGDRLGLRLVFEDQGPGIADIELALTDGFTTNRGMGLGLGGSKRLVNEFEIASGAGSGTRVTLTRWR
jgi:serine/threonine-protein kinase RsbT